MRDRGELFTIEMMGQVVAVTTQSCPAALSTEKYRLKKLK